MSVSDKQKPIETGIGPRPEPSEILQGIDLSGKTALVTGGHSGIGKETVRALRDAGAHVHVPARDTARATKELDSILEPSHIGHMDLSDLTSIARFSEDFLSRHGNIDILIANAGVMACPEQRTAQGWEWQIGVNHFGHFALIENLRDGLTAGDGARVVTLSSVGHRISGIDFDDMHYNTRPYEKWQAYGQSKTAKSLLAVELQARYGEQGIEAFSVHPGGIFTPLQRHLPNEEMVVLGWTTEDGKPSELAAAGFKTPAQGAGTSLWAATSPELNGLGGVYCEDCNIAALKAPDADGYDGVRQWAVDQEIAAKLWDVTQKAIADA
ncbi:oxidoreductase [Alphaproteobacteria bacterium]|nr:oxidoreductase [Alphaproteobacteria bacterium]MDB2668248.1 oxidoreductase [Alphaproteobacteria bacterium]MDC0131447.1 oxidoreductase [Alphaproteobacteria bacterium]MDC0148681.1 oxidoreductase [Alphaproteobacteria bacterium]